MTDGELYGHDAVYVPVCDEIGLDLGWWPWRLPDPNPMPHVVISDRLDALLAVWDEARLRFWVALDVLRRGPDEVLR